MMARDGIVMQEERKMRQAEGFDSGLVIEANEKKQWYKADGTPVGGLLPVDAYHYERFKARGWTLLPPMVLLPEIEVINPTAFLADPLDTYPEGTFPVTKAEVLNDMEFLDPTETVEKVKTPRQIREAAEYQVQPALPVDEEETE